MFIYKVTGILFKDLRIYDPVFRTSGSIGTDK